MNTIFFFLVQIRNLVPIRKCLISYSPVRLVVQEKAQRVEDPGLGKTLD